MDLLESLLPPSAGLGKVVWKPWGSISARLLAWDSTVGAAAEYDMESRPLSSHLVSFAQYSSSKSMLGVSMVTHTKFPPAPMSLPRGVHRLDQRAGESGGYAANCSSGSDSSAIPGYHC